MCVCDIVLCVCVCVLVSKMSNKMNIIREEEE